ncbi:FGFR1 oncogene partner [Holothuria leucospilota]|uniref:Centrosomal protein 43 n=1 Tax=Holothuria leucospilota TaxID=206669 RepID=A0A9Q1BIU4_HOLLE|nr:FGFR1 oncogene partner [Holothuria leucospilota]
MSADEDTELRDLVAQTLETSGVLGKIRAELRASVFLALEEQNTREKKTPFVNQDLKTFLQSKDGLTITSLVLEFLNFFNLDFTAAVFNPEANLGEKCEGREELKKRLNLESTEKKPLLYDLLEKSRGGTQQPLKPLTGNTENYSIPENLSKAQIEDARKKFEFYDKDKSGSIDKDELRSLFIDVFPHFHRNMLERYVNDEFSAGDTDFSSGIEFDEFLAMYKRLFILCRGVVAQGVDNMVPESTRKPAIGSAGEPKVNGSVRNDMLPPANKDQNRSTLPQSWGRSNSGEKDDFFDDMFGNSGTGLRKSSGGQMAPPSSPPRSPTKSGSGGGLSSLSDAPSLFGPPGGSSLLGSPPVVNKPARSPDWKDLADMDDKISRLNFDDRKDRSGEQRTPGDGDGKKSQSHDGDDYEDDFQSSSPGSPSQEGRSHKSKGESIDNSISEEIPEELSGDDDFLASSQERVDDLTTDRSLSQFSQGGDIEYMEDVQLNS